MSTQTAARPSARKHEAFVEAQLRRARLRIRALDTATAALGLAAGALAYGLLMALCDSVLELSLATRQVACALFGLAALAYAARFIAWPWFRQVNPYYAALQVEHALPGAKNSVVNWLDLHDEELPASIRTAVAHRAARDLARADLDQAISARRTAWAGGVAGALFLALVVAFLRYGPFQFASLMGRAFSPFARAAIATRTHLRLVAPEGDVTVPIDRAVSFAAEVEGRVPEPRAPDAARVLYHYQPNEPYEEQVLEKDPATGQWTTVVPAYQVHNGFWYKLAAGDAETPEYRVQVRSTPLVSEFEVGYHFRPYLGWADQVSKDPNLSGMRGTEVTLVARTNRNVRDGRLEMVEGRRDVAGEVVPGDPQALRFRLTLETSGTYRVWFTSVEGERNADPMDYTIKVQTDQVPRVVLTKPGKDVHLPVNGVLRLEGLASDDFGLTGLTLRLKLPGEDKPRGKPYRDHKALRRADGSLPQRLEYQDFVDLAKLGRADGEALQKGMTVEYWLEATDNCDYPAPNVGRSDRFHVVLDDPEKDPKKSEEQRQQARKDQQRHDSEQDRKLEQQQKQDASPQEKQHSGKGKSGKGSSGGNPEGGKAQDRPDDPTRKKADEFQKAIDQKGQGDSSDKREGDSSDKRQGQGGGEDKGKDQPPDKAGDPSGKQEGTDKGQEKSSSGKTQDKSAPGKAREKPGNAGGKSEQPRQPSKENGQDKKAGQDQPGAGGQQKPDQGKPQHKENAGGEEPGARPDDRQPSGKKPGGEKSAGQEKSGGGQEKGDGGERNSEKASPKPGGEKPAGAKPGSEDRQVGPQGQQPGDNQNPGGAKQPGTKDQAAGREGGSNDQPGGGKEQPGGRGEPGKSAAPKDSEDNGAGPVGDLAKQLQSKDAAAREEARQKLDDLKKNATDPAVRKAAGEALAKGEKAQGQDKNSGVEGLAKKLESSDPKTRAEAAKKLEDLKRNASDPQTRQAAADALQKAGRDAEAKGQNAGQEKAGESGDKKGESSSGSEKPNASGKKNDAGDGAGKQPRPKNEGDNHPAGKPQDGPEGGEPGGKSGQTGDKNDPGAEGDNGKQPEPGRSGKPGERSGPNSPTAGKDAKGSRAAPGNRPGDSAGERMDAPPAQGPHVEPPPVNPPDPTDARRAGQLQLERFKKNKDVALKKLNWTEEEYRQFLKAYGQMLKRENQAPQAAEKLADPKRGGGTLKNIGPHRAEGTGNGEDTPYRGMALPPARYRSGFKEFTERINEEKAREKE